MSNMVHKEINNIFSLITNKFFNNHLLSVIFSQTDILKFMIKNIVNKNLIFKHNNFHVQTLYFPILFEILRLISTSENTEIIKYLENHSKWSIFNQFFFIPLKERLKEGLLPLNKNTTKSFRYSDADEYFGENSDNNINHSPNEKRNRSKRSSSLELQLKMLPFRDFVSQLCIDYNTGKQDSIISTELTIIHSMHKEDDTDFENNDTYHLCDDGICIHDSIYHNLSINDSGNNLFVSNKFDVSNINIDKANNFNNSSGNLYYDNVYWAANLIVDEMELDEITKNLLSFNSNNNSNSRNSLFGTKNSSNSLTNLSIENKGDSEGFILNSTNSGKYNEKKENNKDNVIISNFKFIPDNNVNN